MNFVYETSPYVFEPCAGVGIWLAVREVKKYYPTSRNVALKFNDIVLRIYPDSCVDDIVEKYGLERRIRNLTAEG